MKEINDIKKISKLGEVFNRLIVGLCIMICGVASIFANNPMTNKLHQEIRNKSHIMSGSAYDYPTLSKGVFINKELDKAGFSNHLTKCKDSPEKFKNIYKYGQDLFAVGNKINKIIEQDFMKKVGQIIPNKSYEAIAYNVPTIDSGYKISYEYTKSPVYTSCYTADITTKKYKKAVLDWWMSNYYDLYQNVQQIVIENGHIVKIGNENVNIRIPIYINKSNFIKLSINKPISEAKDWEFSHYLEGNPNADWFYLEKIKNNFYKISKKNLETGKLSFEPGVYSKKDIESTNDIAILNILDKNDNIDPEKKYYNLGIYYSDHKFITDISEKVNSLDYKYGDKINLNNQIYNHKGIATYIDVENMSSKYTHLPSNNHIFYINKAINNKQVLIGPSGKILSDMKPVEDYFSNQLYSRRDSVFNKPKISGVIMGNNLLGLQNKSKVLSKIYKKHSHLNSYILECLYDKDNDQIYYKSNNEYINQYNTACIDKSSKKPFNLLINVSLGEHKGLYDQIFRGNNLIIDLQPVSMKKKDYKKFISFANEQQSNVYYENLAFNLNNLNSNFHIPYFSSQKVTYNATNNSNDIFIYDNDTYEYSYQLIKKTKVNNKNSSHLPKSQDISNVFDYLSKLEE